MTKRIWVSMCLVALLAVPAHGDKEQNKLMKRKLEAAQKVLEGVTMNDFKLISQNADELIMISKEAEWKVMKSPEYEVFSNDFRRTCDTLVKNAKEKNSDAAALAYVEMTMCCVKCHKYVREVRKTEGPSQPRKVAMMP